MVASYPGPANNNTFQANAQLDSWLVTTTTGKGQAEAEPAGKGARVCMCVKGRAREESVMKRKGDVSMFVCARVGVQSAEKI